jgi:hypothetical protein
MRIDTYTFYLPPTIRNYRDWLGFGTASANPVCVDEGPLNMPPTALLCTAAGLSKAIFPSRKITCDVHSIE